MSALDKLTAAEKALLSINTEISIELRRNGVPLDHVQAMILARMEDGPISVSLLHGVAYLGTNISYNVQKLVQHGYVKKRANEGDRRGTLLTITEKGRQVRALVTAVVEHNVNFGARAERAVA